MLATNLTESKLIPLPIIFCALGIGRFTPEARNAALDNGVLAVRTYFGPLAY